MQKLLTKLSLPCIPYDFIKNSEEKYGMGLG